MYTKLSINNISKYRIHSSFHIMLLDEKHFMVRIHVKDPVSKRRAIQGHCQRKILNILVFGAILE